MKEQLDKINLRISEAQTKYAEYMKTIPVDLEARSAEQEAGRSKLFDEFETLNNLGVTSRKAYEDHLKLKRFEAEAKANSGSAEGKTSGAEYRSAGSGMQVSDKAVYEGRNAVGQQIADMWNSRHNEGTREGIAAHKRLVEMETRRMHIQSVYSRAADYPTQQEAVVSKGGIFLETERSFELMTHGFSNGALASQCRRMSMGGAVGMHEIYGFWEQSRKDGDRYAGLRFVPMEELQEVVRQAMDFANLFKIQPRKLGAGFNMSNELARDVPMVQSIVMDLFKNSWAWDLDWYIWQASGGKEPGVGVMNAQARLDILPEAGQDANTIVNENILKMQMHMPARSWGNARWYFNQFLLDQLYGLYFPTGDGGELSRIFKPAATPDGEAALGGRPAIPIEQISPIGRVGDIAYLDLNQMLITDKGGMRTGSSVEVNWWNDQTAVKLTTEIDIQPLYKDKVQVFADESGLEKYVSPFIMLGERK